MKCAIHTMRSADWEQVRTIYLEGIATGNATFETDAPSWEKWDQAHLREPRLVARAGEAVLGWASLIPVSSRSAYSGVAEVSLYVAAGSRGQGVGSALLSALIEASEKTGMWSLQGGIFPENAASLALVRKHGFREIGRREKVGKMTHGPLQGTWRDVVLVERRSRVVGTG